MVLLESGLNCLIQKKRKLVDDFVLEGDQKSIHILNAVSPAFTCSLPFSKYIVDKIEVSNNRRTQKSGSVRSEQKIDFSGNNEQVNLHTQ